MEFQLTKNQQSIFETVETTNDNILIVGKPGVGKSVLIRALTEEGRKSYTLAAPTGLAALNIGGRTLHSIFRLPVSQGIISRSFNNFPVDDRVISFIRYQIRALIIDEVSMVRADTFDYIDRMLRFIKEVDAPFGGVQIIAIGDFYQLPPVVVKDEVQQLRLEGYSSPFIFSSAVFGNNFKTLMLNEVLRQKGDPDFVELLDYARDGSVHPRHCTLLNANVGRPNDIRISLTSTNKEAEAVNYNKLREIQSEAVLFQSSEFGEWPAYPAERELTLKVGAQVMVKMNGADKPPKSMDRLFKSKVVNGSLGKVIDICNGRATVNKNGLEIPAGEEKDAEGVEYVVIELENGERVKIYRKRWERKVKVKNGDKWEEKVVASFEQIPLALAWAISIHKSQGQSFDKVHIDAGRIFAPGQLYVALSRCRSLAGISLESAVTTRKFWANRDVISFFNELEVA
jgi:ATP-dependent DNA helicase PIF1